MNLDRVVLTKDEGQWLARNIIKSHNLLLEKSKKDPEALDRVTFKTFEALLPTAKEIQSVIEQLKDEPFEIDVKISGKQKTVVRQIINMTTKSLELIKQKYNAQGKDTYAQDVERKIALLNKMVRKFR